MLRVISARCVASDMHTITPGPLERMCWRWLAAQWGDCKKSRIAPLNVIIIMFLSVKPQDSWKWTKRKKTRTALTNDGWEEKKVLYIWISHTWSCVEICWLQCSVSLLYSDLIVRNCRTSRLLKMDSEKKKQEQQQQMMDGKKRKR